MPDHVYQRLHLTSPSEPTLPTSTATKKIPTKLLVLTRFCGVVKKALFSSWINILLVFVPAGIAVQIAHLNPTLVFVINAIAIVPLAGTLSHATERVAHSVGDTLGALLNVSFGNAVELIIFIIALVKNEIRIVQASLLGSILVNLLLILGMCFLVGGLNYREQLYNNMTTQLSACLLSLSVMSMLLSTAFHASFRDAHLANKAVLKVSRGSSVILLLVYILYLIFQLRSHAYLHESTPQNVIDEESHPGILRHTQASTAMASTNRTQRAKRKLGLRLGNKRQATVIDEDKEKVVREDEVVTGAITSSATEPPRTLPPPMQPLLGARSAALHICRPSFPHSVQSLPNIPTYRAPTPVGPFLQEVEATAPAISLTSSILLLLASTALVALCAEFLVSSISHLVEMTPLSEAFIGLIILPIVGNAAEHVTAVTVAAHNKMDLAIGVAVGSSIQIALFVTPLVVILGWVLEKTMSLYLNLFETVTLVASVFVVNFLVLDGRSNYLEGALLCAAYVIIAVGAWFYPSIEGQSELSGGPAGRSVGLGTLG